jgi:hypothetical protein
LSAEILAPGSTVVEHLTQNPKIQGLTPTTGTGRERMAKNSYQHVLGSIVLKFLHKLESSHVLNTNSLAYLATPKSARLKVIIVSLLLLYSFISISIIDIELLSLLFLDTRKHREKEKFETVFSASFNLFLSQKQWCSTLCLI